jgi:hypothetical protein
MPVVAARDDRAARAGADDIDRGILPRTVEALCRRPPLVD